MTRSRELIEPPPLVVRSSLAALAQPNPRPNKSNLTLEGFLGGQLVHDVQEIVLAVALTLPFPFSLFLLVVVVVLTCKKSFGAFPGNVSLHFSISSRFAKNAWSFWKKLFLWLYGKQTLWSIEESRPIVFKGLHGGNLDPRQWTS